MLVISTGIVPRHVSRNNDVCMYARLSRHMMEMQCILSLCVCVAATVDNVSLSGTITVYSAHTAVLLNCASNLELFNQPRAMNKLSR
jgi:hypothetical protein